MNLPRCTEFCASHPKNHGISKLVSFGDPRNLILESSFNFKLTCFVTSKLKPVRKNKKQIGQAPALSRSLWKEWIKFIASQCGARIAVVLSFTGNFGLRCSEALTLKREDISIQGDIPKLIITGDTGGNKKSPGEVYVRKCHVRWLKSLLTNGFTTQRKRKHKHGSCDFEDTYVAVQEGYIFLLEGQMILRVYIQ